MPEEIKPVTVEPPAYVAPESQADLDRIIADRLSREKAKYSDYTDLKKKADEFDKLAEAQKTETQKAQDRADAAEKRIAEFETAKQVEAWKADVAKAAGVPVEALRGSTLEELQAHGETLKALIPRSEPKKGAIGPYVPSEGTLPSQPVVGDAGAQFAAFIHQQLQG